MFAAREKGRNAKVINRSLFIDNQAYGINSIPNEYRPVRWIVRTIQGMYFSFIRRVAQRECSWSESSIWLVPGLQPSQGKCMCIYVGYICVCVLCPFIYFFS